MSKSFFIKVFLVIVTLFVLTGCKEQTPEPIICDSGYSLVDDVCTLDPIDEPEATFEYGVINGDFEFNMQAWDYYTTDGFHDIATEGARGGNKALSIENGATVYTSIWQTIDVNLANGPLENDFVSFEAYFKGAVGVTGTVYLAIENIVDESTKVVIAQSESITLTEGSYVKIETSVGEIPTGAQKINIVMVFKTTGVILVDDVKLSEKMSNNALASSILADDTELTGFQPDIKTYKVYLPSSTVPVITANAVKSDSVVSVTQAATVNDVATVEITAADATKVTYTINFVVALATNLKDLKVNGQTIVGFDASDLEYYVLLSDNTLPVVTYLTYYTETEVTLSTLDSVPGMLTLTVSDGVTLVEYIVTFGVADANLYVIPNLGFESSFDWQTWTATSNVPGVTTDQVHSGLYALVTYHQSSVWKEFSITENLPQINDAVKVGAWVYINATTPDYNFVLKVVGYTESTNVKQIFVETQITDGIELGQWVYIESIVNDIKKCDRLQIVIENNTNGMVYVDDIQIIEGVSHNANLAQIQLDSVNLNGFDQNVLTYSFLTDGVNVPVVTATSVNGNATVEIIQATSVTDEATIVVTAVDETQKTYVVNFLIASGGLLDSIALDGTVLVDFDSVKNTYYYVFNEGTFEFPTVTATLMDETDTLDITQGTLPGYAVVTVTTLEGGVNVYYIYGESVNPDALSTPYPDVNFDKNLENWGVSSTTDVFQTSERFLNGSKSLKMLTGEAWVGFDLAGGEYPSKDKPYSVGMWIYVDGTATGDFLIRLFEKENNIELIRESISGIESGKWVYVETIISGNVSQDASYLQIVITNATGVTVFVDGIRFIEQISLGEVSNETVYAMTGKNLDFETTTEWGFWSPSGTGVAYSSTVSLDTQSLMMSEGSAWIGFGFDGPSYPAKGDDIKLGFWIYVDSATATSVGGFTIKIIEKDGANPNAVVVIYTTSHGEFAMDEWVYIETQVVTISNDPDYLQIVIEEGTDGTVYVDNITLIKVTE